MKILRRVLDWLADAALGGARARAIDEIRLAARDIRGSSVGAVVKADIDQAVREAVTAAMHPRTYDMLGADYRMHVGNNRQQVARSVDYASMAAVGAGGARKQGGS